MLRRNSDIVEKQLALMILLLGGGCQHSVDVGVVIGAKGYSSDWRHDSCTENELRVFGGGCHDTAWMLDSNWGKRVFS